MQDEIQATDSIIGDIGRVLIDKYFPSRSVSDPNAVPEPVAAKPLLKATPLTIGSPIVIVAAIVASYLYFK
jgi:hypothetical protein